MNHHKSLHCSNTKVSIIPLWLQKQTNKRQYSRISKYYNKIRTIIKASLILVLLNTSPTYAISIFNKEQGYTKVGKFRIKAQQVTKASQTWQNGDIVLHITNGTITKEDGSIEIVASDATIHINLFSLLKLRPTIKIHKLKNATINIHRTQNTNTKRKRYTNLKAMTSLLEKNLLIMLIDDNIKDKTRLENVNIQIHHRAGETHSMHIDKLFLSNNEAVSQSIIPEFNPQDHKSLIGNGTINNSRVKINISCQSKRFGNMCNLALHNVPGSLLNNIVRTPHKKIKQILKFSNLLFDINMSFGSHLKDNSIWSFIYLKKTGIITFWNNESVTVSPTMGKLRIDLQNNKISLTPIFIDAHNVSTGYFGFDLNVPNQHQAKQSTFYWRTDDIYTEGINKILGIIKGIEGIGNIIEGIISNVKFKGGSIAIQNARITDYKNKSLQHNIDITTNDLAVSVDILNNVLLRNIKSTIRTNANDTIVNLHKFKIGNGDLKDANILIKHLANQTPKMHIKVNGNSINFTEVLSNSSMPSYARTLRDALEINPSSTISGFIHANILLSNNIKLKDRLTLASVATIKNLSGSYLNSKTSGVVITSQKQASSQDLEVKANFGNTEINFGKLVQIKPPTKNFELQFRIADTFTKDTNTEHNLHIPNFVIRETGLPSLVLANGSFKGQLEDSFSKSSFKVKLDTFKLVNSDISGKIGKGKGKNYSFDIIGKKLDWVNLTHVYNQISITSDSNDRFQDLILKGILSIDNIKMFNAVHAHNTHSKCILKDGIFNDLQISADLIQDKPNNNFVLSPKHLARKVKTNRKKRKNKTADSAGLMMLSGLPKGDNQSLLIWAKKSNTEDKLYTHAANAKLLLDALNVAQDLSVNLDKFDLSINAKQSNNHIRGTASIDDTFYYKLPTTNEQKLVEIDRVLMPFNLSIHDMFLQMRGIKIRTDILNAVAMGYINFPENTIYMTGKFKLFRKRRKVAASTDLPFIGGVLRPSATLNRPILILNFTIDGPLNAIAQNTTVKPSNSLFLLGGAGGLGIFGAILAAVALAI